MKFRGRDIVAVILAGMVVYSGVAARASAEPPVVEPTEQSLAEPLASKAAGQSATVAAGSAHSGIQAEILLKADSSWDGVPYSAYPAGRPEVTVVRLTIPPHTALPWHTHPMPNAAYVVSGSIVVERESDRSRRLLGAGQVLAEMVDSPHRGITGDEPVVLMVFYAGTAEMPLSVEH